MYYSKPLTIRSRISKSSPYDIYFILWNIISIMKNIQLSYKYSLITSKIIYPSIFYLLFIFWYKLIYEDCDNSTLWLWELWNDVYQFCLISYIHKILVEYIHMIYRNSIFPFFFKTLMFEDDRRPNLTKDVFSTFKIFIQNNFI